VFHPFGDPPYPPHILLYNSGTVDALAVTFEMNIWEGRILKNGSPAISTSRIPIPKWVGEIPARKTHPPILVSMPSTQAQGPEEFRRSRERFIQLIIRYLRPSDRKSYDRRFYYFVGTNGTWVSETYPESDSTEFNRRIKQALKHPDYLSDRDPPPSVFDQGHITPK
jgi:hypothetical protein